WAARSRGRVPLARARSRRRPGRCDIRRLDPRQGRARRGDEAARRALPAVRLRKPQGLLHSRAPRGTQALRPLRDPPPQLRAGPAPAAAGAAVLMKAVASRDNAAYKAMARLISSSSERRRSGLSVLDGTHLLAAFL